MRKSSLLPLLLLILSACGMADDERVEDSKRRFITIADPAFEAYLLRTWDLDHDGRISYYEAERGAAYRLRGAGDRVAVRYRELHLAADARLLVERADVARREPPVEAGAARLLPKRTGAPASGRAGAASGFWIAPTIGSTI